MRFECIVWNRWIELRIFKKKKNRSNLKYFSQFLSTESVAVVDQLLLTYASYKCKL